MTVRVLFLSEGTSDQGLVSHVEGIAADLGVPVAVSAPDLRWLRIPAGHSVIDKLRTTRDMGGAYDLAVIQRDADRGAPQDRRTEMANAVGEVWPGLAHVPAVPVRMLEAWLLLDEQAIREVAGNPRGRIPLDLPKAASVERVADPKQRLKDTIATASGCKGRRLTELHQRFPRNRHRLLDLLDRDGPVSEVASWRTFVAELSAALRAVAPGRSS
ncbi:hypothetical protein [Streptomyces sp. CRN 30]|uniref:hypothetical protein n=1 Tax=Streptomyces sp. CRN 30 TaxID=3075613 RepID=UPI002A7ECBC9|nr:hypothetical protein [Streptomyces sp. CRN 30]